MTSRGKVRVLHTLGWLTYGGVEQLRLLLASNLPSDRFDHLLICQQASVEMKEKFEEAGWEVKEIGLAPGILSFRWHLKAIRIALQFRPSLIHGAVFEGNALATSCGVFLPQIPVVLEEQSGALGRSWRGTLLLRLMSLRARAFVGVAPQITSYLRDVAKIQSSKVRLVLNGARLSAGLSSKKGVGFRNGLGISKDTIVLGSVGRLLDNHKRFSLLIRMLPELIRGGHQVALVILGEGKDRDLYEQLIHELGVESSVFLPGSLGSHLVGRTNWYEEMDIFILPSAGEALPLALVEAMHAGVPCIATAVGGNPFVLDHGKAGLLIETNCPEQLIEATARLIKSASLRQLLGHRGQQYAGTIFTPEKYTERVMALWDECLPRQSRAGGRDGIGNNFSH